MKASTPIGIAVGIAGILAGAAMEGTPLGGLLNIPALLIILGGVAGVSIATSGMELMKLMPTLYKKAMTPEFPDQPATVRQLVGYAEKARKEGLLALEPEIAAIDDEFTKKGLQLVVDGTDPDLVREVLEVEIESMEGRHRANQKLFKDAGGYAPTIGVLGTVMGLLHVMQLLQTPELLGPAIAGAFMATLYGVGSANIIFLPVAGRLAVLTQSEAQNRTMVIEGILAIQAGENPRVIGERLLGYLPPEAREQAAGSGPNLKAVPDDMAAQAA
jgi:chemotaxis protein MotA